MGSTQSILWACADLPKLGPADHILITDSRELVGTSRDGPWRGFGETPGRGYERGRAGTSRDWLEVTGSQGVRIPSAALPLRSRPIRPRSRYWGRVSSSAQRLAASRFGWQRMPDRRVSRRRFESPQLHFHFVRGLFGLEVVTGGGFLLLPNGSRHLGLDGNECLTGAFRGGGSNPLSSTRLNPGVAHNKCG